MKLWEIKAQSLRIMFADTDIEFSRDEFESGSIYNNGNTREKLVRMNDSIRRAIDLYYMHTKAQSSILQFDENSAGFSRTDYAINITIPSEIKRVRKVNVKTYGCQRQIDFYYDSSNSMVVIDLYENGLQHVSSDVFKIVIFFEEERLNLPPDMDIDDLTTDLDDYNIPEDIQRVIPKFVKGELYEEDEYAVAMNSKNEYIQYLMSLSRKYSTVQQKVKSIHRRG